jgi:hypothetical protein
MMIGWTHKRDGKVIREKCGKMKIQKGCREGGKKLLCLSS